MSQTSKATLYRWLSAGLMSSVMPGVLQMTGLAVLMTMKPSLLMEPAAGMRKDAFERHGLIVLPEALLASN